MATTNNKNDTLLNEGTVRELISKGDLFGLRHQFKNCEPNEVGNLIERLASPDDIIAFRVLSREMATETFHHLSFDKQKELIDSLAYKQQRLRELLDNLRADDRTALLEELPAPVAQGLIQKLSHEEQKVATELLGYPKDSIGRLMTLDYVAVYPHFTIRETLEHIREYGSDSETFNVIYVVDENAELIDDLRIREILLAGPEDKIADIMDDRFVSLQANEDQESAVKVFRDYDRVALPVTDTKGILMGIVTDDDVLDVAEEEATEDFHRFGSLQDAIFDPLKAKIPLLYQKRILWLLALVLMNIFSGAAIASFEQTIANAVALVFFLPLLIDSGGNAGAQSATLMTRALATGEVQMKNWVKLVGKEITVSFLLGLTMAVAVSIVASFRAPEVLVVVSLTMVSIVLVGSLVGLTLPFVFTKFGIDPATASAPLITSLADIFGVLIYFSIATWYFNFSG